MGRRLSVGHACSNESRQICRLLCTEDGPFDIRPGRAHGLASRVKKAEPLAWESVRRAGKCGDLVESHCDNQVVPLPRKVGERGDELVAYAGRVRRNSLGANVQIPSSPHEPPVRAVLERIASDTYERLLEDEAHPKLAAAVRPQGPESQSGNSDGGKRDRTSDRPTLNPPRSEV